MRAGRLDRRIVIQKDTPTRSATGAEKQAWSTLATVWAEKRHVAGGETFRGVQVVAKATLAFVIRHRTDVTTKMRVSYDGELYDIHRIDELGRRDGLIIQASAVNV